MRVSREDALELQMALVQLHQQGIKIRLRDGSPRLSGAAPAEVVEVLKKYREWLIRSLSREHCFDGEEPVPISAASIEVVDAHWRHHAIGILNERIPFRWIRWRYEKTRLWFFSNGEIWLEPTTEEQEQ